MTIETAAAPPDGAAPAGQEADPAMAPKVTCPNCGAPDPLVEPDSRFCEECGYELDEPVTGEQDLATQTGPRPCASCEGTEFDDEGYCLGCGDLQPRRRDRMEANLGLVAGISDRGRRHHRNEDSMALRPTAGPDDRNVVVAVVCDGVSTSERPDEASAAAVSAAAKWLLAAITSGTTEPERGSGSGSAASASAASEPGREPQPERTPAHTEPVETAVMATVSLDAPPEPEMPDTEPPGEDSGDSGAGAAGGSGSGSRAAGATGPRRPLSAAELGLLSRQAAREADKAVSDLERDSDHGNPPACTYVSAVVGADVTVAWLGDSRAYWLDERGTARALTRDDAAEGSHAIEAWLGADSGGPEPHLARFTPDGPGVVLVCSDGLWNYCSEAAELRDLLREKAAAANGDPLATADALVAWANEQGGHDNITAALARTESTEPTAPTGSE